MKSRNKNQEARSTLESFGYESRCILPSHLSLNKSIYLGYSRVPCVPRSLCLAICEPDEGTTSSETVRRLGEHDGAPIVIALTNDTAELWHTRLNGPPYLVETKPINEVKAAWSERLSPAAIRRMKASSPESIDPQTGLFALTPPSQSAVSIDPGILRAFELRQAELLRGLLERILSALGDKSDDDSSLHQKITLAFWIVAARVLRDYKIPAFSNIDHSEPATVIKAMEHHYTNVRSMLSHRLSTTPSGLSSLKHACNIAFTDREINTACITPEVLGYVNETFRVSPEVRKALGFHSTPTYVVDYIMRDLSELIAQLPIDQRIIAEPACGHAAFLVAALRILSDNHPPDGERPVYLRRSLKGIDIDKYSTEIAQLSLAIADIPNPDAWRIGEGDVFDDSVLNTLIADAAVVISNPPFEEFDSTSLPDGISTQDSKAIDLFSRCLHRSQPGTILAFVLPHKFLDSPTQSIVTLRRFIVEQCTIRKIVELPDGVFQCADTDSCIIILQKIPPPNDAQWQHVSIKRALLKAFQITLSVPDDCIRLNTKSDVIVHPTFSLLRSPHWMMWVSSRWQSMENWTEHIGQGTTFIESKIIPDGESISRIKVGHSARKCLVNSIPPSETYVLPSRATIRHGKPTDQPRVVVNRVRRTRYNWRLQPFIDWKGSDYIDGSGFVFIPSSGINEPAEDRCWLIWAVLNTPITQVFVREHFFTNSISPFGLKRIPIPRLTPDSKSRLLDAIRTAYQSKEVGELINNMLRLDAQMHAAYGLIAEEEWSILQGLQGKERPGVGLYPDLRGYDKRLPLYLLLQPEVPVVLPPVDSLGVPASIGELDYLEVRIYNELAALEEYAANRTDTRVEDRVIWLTSWLRSIQAWELGVRFPMISSSTDVHFLNASEGTSHD